MDPLKEVQNLIENNMNCDIVKVSDMTGTMDHLEILIVSKEFEGKILIDQHQMIMDILSESLKEKIHAVKLKTMTPEKYEKKFGGNNV